MWEVRTLNSDRWPFSNPKRFLSDACALLSGLGLADRGTNSLLILRHKLLREVSLSLGGTRRVLCGLSRILHSLTLIGGNADGLPSSLSLFSGRFALLADREVLKPTLTTE